MLLNHTGGIPESQSPPKLFALRPIIEARAEDPLWSPPGRLFNYSNADYALLAAVIAERTGRRFEDVVSERVMRPAGMQTASYDVGDGHGLAAGHDAAGRVIWTRPHESEPARAAGGVIASVIDYAHFAEKLLAHGGGVLASSSVEAMMTGHALMQAQPQQLYGYGLYETEQAGLHIVEHAGSAAGFSTLVRLVPARNFAVIAFDNGSHPPDDVVDAATSAFLDAPETPRARVLTPPSTWAKYTGSYVDPTGALGEFDVVLKNEKLWFVPHDGKRGQVTHNLRGSFEAGPDGSIEYFVTRAGVARRRTELLSSAAGRQP
jgi:CubicO group peptidase (beta-lactamase class C family)